MAVTVVTGEMQGAMESQAGSPMLEALAASESMNAATEPMPGAEELPAAPYDPGPSRTDLDRFTGLYSDPAQPDERKESFWAAPGCDGRLVTGATWADASPWWMRSVSDRGFEYEDSWTQITMEFQGAAGESATGMTHDREDIRLAP